LWRQTGDWRKLSTVEEIEDLFPKEVVYAINNDF